jgi:hypothetical protein
MTLKEHAMNAANDAGTDFAYYDRKEDEVLDHRALKTLLANGEVTVEQLCAEFAKGIRDAL